MESWYDFKKLYESEEQTEADLNKKLLNYHHTEFWDSVKMVTDLIKKEIDQLGDASRVYVGGFGNGAAISLATFL